MNRLTNAHFYRCLIREAINAGFISRIRLEMQFVDTHKNRRLNGIPNYELVEIYKSEIDHYDAFVKKRYARLRKLNEQNN